MTATLRGRVHHFNDRPVAQSGAMAEHVAVRDITNEEGNKLLQIVRRGSGSVVRWRRAQIVLWSAQRMDVPAIAKIAFTSEDRVREVIYNFNADGFDSLAPKYSGGRPPKFSVEERAAVKKIALGRPDRLRRAILHLVADEVGRPPGAEEGWSTTSATRELRALLPRGGCLLSSHQDLRRILTTMTSR